MKRKKPIINEHLASLSVQYNVYPAEIFQALISARENTKAQCQDLMIEYRGTVDDEAIFLIKKNNKAIVQFRVAEETLQQKNLAFDNWMENDKIRKQIAKQNPAEPVFTPIRDLRHGMKKVNLEAQVLETPEPKMVHTQFGNTVLMANTWIADETGKIKLCLWDQQVSSVAAGNTVQIKNASVSTFKGEKQLRLGKTGTLTVSQSGSSKPKQPDNGKANKVICA